MDLLKEKMDTENTEKETRKKSKGKHKELEELRVTVENLQKEKDELFGRLQRVSADYANFQKRVHKQISDTIAYEKETIIKALLPILDNFERTLKNTHLSENVDVIINGVKIIYDQILDILKLHGVKQIKAAGEVFDPALHEAVMQKAEPGRDDNIVLEEDRKGYKLNGRVIRPCRVIVNKLTPEAEAQKTEEVKQEPDEQKLEKENNQ